MNKTRRTLLVFLTTLIAVITIALWQRNTTHNAKAAPPIISETQPKDVTAQGQLEAPVTDLVVDAMEVTQAVQDLNNSVPMVMGKRTYVRVYTHSTNGTYPTTAVLRVQFGGSGVSLLPIKPGGPFINVRPTYNRLISTQAFLFEIPTYITYFSPLTLTAEVNPILYWHNRSPEEFSYSNNSISKSFTFNEIPPLHLVIASTPYRINNNTFSPSLYDMWSMTDWIKRAYPINQLKVYFRTLPTFNAQRKQDDNNNWDMVFPNCSFLNSYMAYRRAAILGNPFVPNDMAFYAMVADTEAFMRGCAPIGGYWLGNQQVRPRVASGPSGPWDHGWDFDGTYADWYGGHELGHAFLNTHVKGGPGYVEDGCGGEAGANKQWPDGRISPTLNYFDPKAVFGFDYRKLYTHSNPILGPNWHDMMTYCDYQWISSNTYLWLQVVFKFSLPQAQPSAPSQPNLQDVLAIFGDINLTTGQLTLRPTSILYNVPDIELPPPGDYAIVLRDIDYAELARYPFSPHGSNEGQSISTNPETQYAYITELVPYVGRTATVQIEGPSGDILAQVDAGLNPPVVEVTAPIRGSVEDGETVLVTWTGSDPDDDPLTYNVDYSADNGASWEPAGMFYTDTQAIIDQTNLPASDVAMVRVSASDGINTTQAISDPFVILNHLPSGEIIAPEMDVTIAVSQTITFEGQVYDIDLGTMDGTEIQWSSSIDGYLGPGAIFNIDNLSIGSHVITMTADDGQGGVLTDQVNVTVVPTPNDLPPQPDELVIEPDPVFLLPTQGINTATVYVDNLNLGNAITWNAVKDQSWLVLSAASGSTPQDIVVSSTLPYSDGGTHTATITFTSPQAPGTHVTVRVVVTIPIYNSYLPVMVR
jgi:hypothetical protein